jgi:hypothetical protein
MMRLQVNKWVARLVRSVRGVGPYAAVELILPGGTLIVLLILAVRHRKVLLARARAALAGAGRKAGRARETDESEPTIGHLSVTLSP